MQIHTDQYLSFTSNHPLEHKLSVIRTLYHRADTVITDDSDKCPEKARIDKSLQRCGYPRWAIAKATKAPTNKGSSAGSQGTHDSQRKGTLVLPYVKKVTEELRRVFRDYGWQVCAKPSNKLRHSLVAPKDKEHKKNRTGVVYHIPCQGKTTRGQCKETYIGETERSLKARFSEHRRASTTSSEVSQHLHIESPGHQVDIDSVKILDREPKYLERGIKEAIYIRTHQPTLNKDGGRYKLPTVYDKVLRSQISKISGLTTQQQ